MADDEEVRLGSRRARRPACVAGSLPGWRLLTAPPPPRAPQAPVFDPTVMKKKKAKARTRSPRQTACSTANRVSSCFRSRRRAVR
jgi:hypothetical protein